MTPTIANLADSKYLARDCNICLGIFSPFKHLLPEYMGYDIRQFKDKIRFVEILINRNGSPGGVCPLFFDGAVNYFAELPLPDDKTEMQKIYNYLKILK